MLHWFALQLSTAAAQSYFGILPAALVVIARARKFLVAGWLMVKERSAARWSAIPMFTWRAVIPAYAKCTYGKGIDSVYVFIAQVIGRTAFTAIYSCVDKKAGCCLIQIFPTLYVIDGRRFKLCCHQYFRVMFDGLQQSKA